MKMNNGTGNEQWEMGNGNLVIAKWEMKMVNPTWK